MRSRKGLSLVELLVAVLVINIGVLGTIGILSTGYRQYVIAVDRVHALNIAERELSVISGLEFENELAMNEAEVLALSGDDLTEWDNRKATGNPGAVMEGAGGSVSPAYTPSGAGESRFRVYAYVYCAPPHQAVSSCENGSSQPYPKRVRVVITSDRTKGSPVHGIASIEAVVG